MKKTLLTRTVKAVDGRNGYITSTDRDFKLDLEIPKEMGGKENDKTNPEELFAAGYSSCFASSMEFLLKNSGIAYTSLFAEVEAKLVTDEKGGGFKFEANITASITGVDEKTKADIIHKAYDFCPYSKAIRSNVDVNIQVV